MGFQKGHPAWNKGKKRGTTVPEKPPDAPEAQEQLTGSPRGYRDMAEKARIGPTPTASFLSDPAVREALKGDTEIEKEIEAEADAELLDIEELLSGLEAEPEKGHHFANGASIPFPYMGADTVNFATCSKPMKDANRGCPVYAHCPLRNKGPFLLAILDKRNRNQIRSTTCVDFLKSGLVFQPHIVLLPGINWEGTLSAEYTPFPDGRMPEPGPGKVKTPIKLTATKSMLPEECFPEPELVRQYQRLRRRGEINSFRL